MNTFMKASIGIFMVLVAGLVFSTTAEAQDKTITIGGKNFTEQYLLPELAKLLLEKEGFSVILRTGVSTVIARQSLETAQIDMYYEYTGTAYTVFYQQDDTGIMSDPGKVYTWVKGQDAEKGLIWLDPLPLDNTYTIMMRKVEAEALNIHSISDFGRYVEQNPGKVTFALESEFWERPDGFRRLMGVYGFRMRPADVKRMDMGLTYLALRDGQVGSAMGFNTDGRIAAFGLLSLDDNMNFFPVYTPAPVVTRATLERYPEIAGILKPLSQKLDNEAMRKLNAAVDVEHKSVTAAAEEWLKEVGLL
ncbi:MAG TPA: glycine/betaine ABC transporter substrate-binding protein [Deltaproteobacteria bacterium]|nr:glycine/betaine ABC transporter substrate-binding protein [Deltaproteobacteria bacterium]